MCACYLHIDRALHSKIITIGCTFADWCRFLRCVKCCAMHICCLWKKNICYKFKCNTIENAQLSLISCSNDNGDEDDYDIGHYGNSKAPIQFGPTHAAQTKLHKFKKSTHTNSQSEQSSKLQSRQKCTLGCCYSACNEKRLMDVRVHECLLCTRLIFYVVRAIGSVDLIENCSYASDFLRNSVWVGLRHMKPFAFNSGLSLAN